MRQMVRTEIEKLPVWVGFLQTVMISVVSALMTGPSITKGIALPDFISIAKCMEGLTTEIKAEEIL
jgi:hypothetical protein